MRGPPELLMVPEPVTVVLYDLLIGLALYFFHFGERQISFTTAHPGFAQDAVRVVNPRIVSGIAESVNRDFARHSPKRASRIHVASNGNLRFASRCL